MRRKIDAAATPEFRAALEYVKNGWPVGFLPYGSKKPAPGGKGLKSFTRDTEALRAWRREMGERCNVAGTPPPGHFVVDVDVYKDRALERVIADIQACGPTPTQRTPRGGFHFVLKGTAPDAAALRAHYGVPEGIDIKDSGKGYILLCPSVVVETH